MRFASHTLSADKVVSRPIRITNTQWVAPLRPGQSTGRPDGDSTALEFRIVNLIAQQHKGANEEFACDGDSRFLTAASPSRKRNKREPALLMLPQRWTPAEECSTGSNPM
jgi:hypothetical protein